MTDKIEPALSAKRWELLRATKNHGQFAIITLEGGNDQEIGAFDADVADTIEAEDVGRQRDDAKRNAAAIAALNDELPDDDRRKITREKIELLRGAVWLTEMDTAEQVAANVRFLDALESYLPPE
jgi:hypothetical protein